MQDYFRIGQLEFCGDIGPEDWKEFFNASWEEYTELARVQMATVAARLGRPPKSRAEIVADTFNEMTLHPDGTHDPFMTQQFYCSRLYDKLMALDMGESGFFRGASTIYDVNWIGEMHEAFVQHVAPSGQYLIHGFGHGQAMLGMMGMDPSGSYYACDIFSPVRLFIIRMIQKYCPAAKLDAAWVIPGDPVLSQPDKRLPLIGTYGLIGVHTCEVLEHIHNPEKVLRSITSNLVGGGIALISTFFNSMNGEDPQHLTENDKYQDVDLWESEVRACGLAPIWKDPRGVTKLWRKEK